MESVFGLLTSGPMTLIFVLIVGLAMIFMIGGRILRLWQKVPPNEILIVYGRGGTKVITGGGGFVWPIIQDAKLMERGVMNVAAQGDQMPTKNNVEVEVDWTAQIQIGESDALIKTAAAAFLDKDQEEIVELIRGSVAGSVRAVIATLTPEEARGDREQFAARVNEIVRDDMERMGLRVTSLNIVEVKDPANTGGQGYYAQLQAKETARVGQEARVAQANADRVAREREAENKLAARNAEIAASQAEAELQRDLDLKRAEFANETNAAQALADMAGGLKRAELERKLRESEGASLLAAETAATQVAEQAAARKRQELEASVVATAEADAKRIVALAGAEQAAAASRAEAVRQAGQAEADSILAKATAEAEGQRALADALNAFDEAGLRQRLALALIGVLPQLADAQATSMSNISEVRILDTGGGNGSGMQRFAQQLPMGILQMLETARVAGINLPEMLAGLTAVTPAQPEVAESDASPKA